ncbi:hypothetical protein [Ruminococcus sp. HUN007]|uniref:hypothetical protein n=1 Tax=Ruminococcus sp. HUN007 TaxID=1514668 RepID=UPI0005D2AEA3|nr:hypothetical protein [Ruminococcus sp. HUN007]
MGKWYNITGTRLLVIIGLSVLWIAAASVIYVLIGSEHGPHGGLDSIADAIVYAFIWKLFIYVLPVLVSVISFMMWLWQKHRRSFIWITAAAILCASASVVYERCLKKYVHTPEYAARKTESFEKWNERQYVSGIYEKYTESDRICTYINSIVSDAVSEWEMYCPPEDEEKKLVYINSVMEAHSGELSHVESWEYIPDVRKLIPPRKDGDPKFLLNNAEMCMIADHYGKKLRTDHWYDRYQFKDSFIAEWYSWLPEMAVIYDDGTMDLVIVR